LVFILVTECLYWLQSVYIGYRVFILVTECFLWLRRLVVGFSPRVPWIQPGLDLVGFMKVKTALWQACSSASVFLYKCHSTNVPSSFQKHFTIADERSMGTLQLKRCFFGNRGERRYKFTFVFIHQSARRPSCPWLQWSDPLFSNIRS